MRNAETVKMLILQGVKELSPFMSKYEKVKAGEVISQIDENTNQRGLISEATWKEITNIVYYMINGEIWRDLVQNVNKE